MSFAAMTGFKMKISDALGSGATLATALFTATNSSAAAAQAASGPSVPSVFVSKDEDTVDLSALASSLKGDGLQLFNNLSTETRNQLAAIVNSGKLSADELNDALNGFLKSARKNVFWQEAGKYQEALPEGSVGAIQLRNSNALDAEYTSSQSKTGYLYGVDAEALRARFANVSQSDGPRPDGVRNKLTPYLMSGSFATENSASAIEVSAALKLRSLGFASDDFEAARNALALDAVTKMIENNKSNMAEWL